MQLRTINEIGSQDDAGHGGDNSANRKQCCRCRFILLTCICVMMISVMLMLRMETLILATFQPFVGRVTGDSSLSSFPVASKRSSVDGAAFVVLALGPQAYQMNCPAAVESLVKHGGWGGDVYLITDRESCFDSEKIVRNAGMEKDKFHLEVLDEDFGGGGIDVLNPKMGFVKNRMRSKSMKTQLFNIVSDPAIEVLAYMDCDILVAKEGCPVEYLHNGDSWEDRSIQFTRIESDAVGHLTNIHSGTILMHRHYSEEALRIWAAELDKHESSMDRFPYLIAYNRIQREIEEQAGIYPLTVNSTALSNGTNVAALLKKNPLFAGEVRRRGGSDSEKVHFENFVQPTGKSPFCFNHISKARCAAFGRDSVQGFVDRFEDLRSYPKGTMYCPSQWISPLLYGYFPLSYLPWCPKLDSYF